MLVVKETNNNLTEIYGFPITFTLYVGTFCIEQNERKLQEIQKIKNKK